MDYLRIMGGALIGLSLSIETLGFFLRAIGSKRKYPSLGYSLHVQVATIARFGSFLGLPVLGSIVDSGLGPKALVTAALSAYVMLTVVLGTGLFVPRWFERTFNIFFDRRLPRRHRQEATNAISKLAGIKLPKAKYHTQIRP